MVDAINQGLPGRRILPDNPPPSAQPPAAPLITIEQLRAICPGAPASAADLVPHLQQLFVLDGITSAAQRAMFLAQAAHESAHFSRMVENLNYSADGLLRTWPARFDVATAGRYARQPERIANKVYALRMGNGPEESGDGWRFRGRGLFQVTGRENYRLCGKGLGIDLILKPDLLELPQHAVASAGWYWRTKGFNAIMAEPPTWRRTVRGVSYDQLQYVTQVINGGQNGVKERRQLYERALQVLT